MMFIQIQKITHLICQEFFFLNQYINT